MPAPGSGFARPRTGYGWHLSLVRFKLPTMRRGYVYIMTNKPSGTLYIGVTSNIAARVYQHRSGTGSDFCRKYGLTRLVLAEPYDTIEEAMVREKALKAWKRSWKLNLIGRCNPAWSDLYPTLHLD